MQYSTSIIRGTASAFLKAQMVTLKDYNFLMSQTSTRFKEVLKGQGAKFDSKTLKEGDLIVIIKDELNAGIYCGNNEVIRSRAPPVTQSLLLPLQTATVSKLSLKNFLRGNDYHIMRLPSIPKNFSDKVSEAMDSSETYNVWSNNSVHFAMKLLELEAKPLQKCNTDTNGFWPNLFDRKGCWKFPQWGFKGHGHDEINNKV
ncbi:hypothetical protein E1301_Tti013027 [Triplophysa tibetana]|uniref:Uncharacterized protein n=1 Tax=Triplophysa tibetana TaxID=1572043 RepID=A0A5A9NLP2_9TELE|nr:hypothetical protein E1301_Tti013027 [Triplophysa tibetana]